MARNSSGTYSLPQTPFVSNTAIAATAENSDFSDIASALTTSLATTGVTPMTGQLKLAAGAVNNPSITFTTSTTTGFYASATNEISVAINGAQVAKINSSGLTMVAQTITDKNSNVIYGLPIGVVMPYAGSTTPAQWLLCYGQAISRTTYSALFTAISTTFGTGDGSTTFNIPDMRGRAAFGKDNMGGVAANKITNAGSGITGTTLGATGGTQNITIAKTNMPNVASFTKTDPTHTHSYTTITFSSNANSGGSFGDDASAGATTGAASITSTWTTGGSGTAVIQLPPMMITNYMIYTGV